MGAYILLWGGLIGANFWLSALDRRIGYLFFKLTIGMLVIFVGLRHQVGGDWSNYLGMLNRLVGASLSQAIAATDPAYGLLNWLTNQWQLGIYPVNLICASIFMWGLGRMCLAQPVPWLALLIATPYLLSAVAMGYTRQSAAIGFAMLALLALPTHKQGRFVILVICATLFHKTAVLLLLLLPLSMPTVRVGRLSIIGLLVGGIGLMLLLEHFGGMWDLYVSQGMASDGGLMRVLLNVVPACCFLLLRRRWQARWPGNYDLVLWLSIASIIALPLQFLASTATDRLSLYMVPLQLIVLSRLPLLFTVDLQLIVMCGVVLCYSTVFMVWLNYSQWAQCCWIPYGNLLMMH